MSWETIERYEKCKCGNPKGVKTSWLSNDWGQSTDSMDIIICEQCNKDYYLSDKRYYSNDGDSGIVQIWNKKLEEK